MQDISADVFSAPGRHPGSQSSKTTRDISSKILELSDLALLRGRLGTQRIVHCHGVFDVLHAGHLAYFESAKKFGDKLVVTITDDKYVNKGPGRPYFSSSIRARMIAALEVVDFVAVSKFPTAEPSIETIKPHFYVKGPDYRDMTKDPTGAIYNEERAAKAGGGELVFTEDETHSSSALINMFFPVWNDEQQATLKQVKDAGGIELIQSLLDGMKQERVLVVGEPIVDTYVFCKPEAISSKSPSISAKFMYEENYAGGSLAIANHLADFVGETAILITHGNEEYFSGMLKTHMDPRVRVVSEVLSDIPTPRKTRFIADDKVQRLFEMTHLRSDQWAYHDPSKFCGKMIEEAKKSTMAIVADFGHGVFEGQPLMAIGDMDTFVALNVQTNSSNFGFNPFTKHKKFNYLSIDLKEARVAYQDRYSSHLELVRKIREDFSKQDAAVSMTLGPQGSYYLPVKAKSEIKAPAFADSVVDALGAGDAFFTLSSLLVKAGAPDIVVPFLGNLFAALKTKIIGNKSAISRSQLLKAAAAVLK